MRSAIGLCGSCLCRHRQGCRARRLDGADHGVLLADGAGGGCGSDVHDVNLMPELVTEIRVVDRGIPGARHDVAVVAHRMDPAREEIVGNPPLRHGAEGKGSWRIQRGCNSWAVRKVLPGSDALRQSGRPICAADRFVTALEREAPFNTDHFHW